MLWLAAVPLERGNPDVALAGGVTMITSVFVICGLISTYYTQKG